MSFLRQKTRVCKNFIPEFNGRPDALGGASDRLLEEMLFVQHRPAAGAFVEMHLQRGPLGIRQLVIDERGDKFLSFGASHFRLAISCSLAMYGLRYSCNSFLPRESRERIVPMGHDRISAASSYVKS